LKGKSVDENMLVATANGAIKLYHDNSEKFRTSNIGITVTGAISPTDHIYLPDNKSLKLGAGHDFILTHDGTNNTINSGNGDLHLQHSNASKVVVTGGAFRPASDGNIDLGTSSYRWQDIYTSDLDLSNEAKGANDIDGTWGHYTIVEGESDLFLKNNRSGKKYKFNLTEVS